MEETKNNLRRGQRYLFYHHAPHEENTTIFRANFVTLYEKSQTLIINNSETEKSKNALISIPFNWITKIKTLEDITKGKSILPPEILLIIDEYL
jgi:hypothetical protein